MATRQWGRVAGTPPVTEDGTLYLSEPRGRGGEGDRKRERGGRERRREGRGGGGGEERR